MGVAVGHGQKDEGRTDRRYLNGKLKVIKGIRWIKHCKGGCFIVDNSRILKKSIKAYIFRFNLLYSVPLFSKIDDTFENARCT